MIIIVGVKEGERERERERERDRERERERVCFGLGASAGNQLTPRSRSWRDLNCGRNNFGVFTPKGAKTSGELSLCTWIPT